MSKIIKKGKDGKPKEKTYIKDSDIAVVGIGCKLPGANNYKAFWNNLYDGVLSRSVIPSNRWDIEKYYSPNIEDTNKTLSKWGGLVEGIDKFDNRFFNISPREAKNMDPQQRILIEEMWHCIEDSGVSLREMQKRKTSVYIGVMASDYHQEASSSDIIIDSYAGLGNYDCILANRISYFFNFTGVSMAVDAACSSSLVAIHEARYSLIVGESDYAIAGGVNLTCHPWKYISFSKSRMLSPDGVCKTFDKDANGYMPGEGIAVILLQRLENALKDGNHIYGLIKGSAVNHGGKTKSITAPRVEAQQEVILSAYKDAALNPDSITYVEAHGTGTSLGDPIEVESLTKAFNEYLPYQVDAFLFETEILDKLEDEMDRELITNLYKKDNRTRTFKLNTDCPGEVLEDLRRVLIKLKFINPGDFQFCSIGSVKSNIGHLEASAGIAGVIKVLMMMKAKWIPESLNINQLNPIINFPLTPFKVAIKPSGWKSRRPDLPLRASVSSFGFGGVNSHAIIEEFVDQRRKKRSSKENEYVFSLSAKSKASLTKLIERWKRFIKTREFDEISSFDLSATLLAGRSHMPYRYGFVFSQRNELVKQLNENNQIFPRKVNRPFCLRIGDINWESMTNVKYFLKKSGAFNLYFTDLRKYFGLDEAKQIYDDIFSNTWKEERKELYRFIMGYAYAHTLMDYGFTPDIISGEGSGVILGIVLSSALDVEDAVKILTKKIKWKDTVFQRPYIPYYDSVLKKTAMPFHFSAGYLSKLIDEMSRKAKVLGKIIVDGIIYTQRSGGDDNQTGEDRLGDILLRLIDGMTEEKLKDALEEQKNTGKRLGDIIVEKGYCNKEEKDKALREQDIVRHLVDEVLKKYVDTARILNTSQFTFRKFLDEWNVALKKFGKDINSLLDDDDLLKQEGDKIRKEKLLLMVIIISSLRKLNQKWDLTEQRLVEEQRFYELIDLVVDSIMPKEYIIEILVGKNPDYNVIAHTLNRRQRNRGLKSAYKLIKLINPNIKEIKDEDKERWYAAAISNKKTLDVKELAYHPIENIQFVQFGELGEIMENDLSLHVRMKGDFAASFKESLLKLWLHGINIKWEKLYPESSFNKVVLPSYPFDRKSFWLERTGKVQDDVDKIVQETQQPVNKLKPVDASGEKYERIYTAKDVILREKMINGMHALPGACLIETGMDAATQACKKNIRLIHDVFLHNHGVLKGRLKLKVDVDRKEKHFTIYSEEESLCEGKYDDGQVELPLPDNIFIPDDSTTLQQDLTDLYTRFEDWGYKMGESLQVIGNLWKQGSLFIFELNALTHSEGGGTGLSPFILDGIVQSALTAINYIIDDVGDDSMYVPYFVTRMALYRDIPRACYVCFDESQIERKGDDYTVNLRVYDERGNPLIYLEKMVFLKVRKSSLFESSGSEGGSVRYYKPVWEAKALMPSSAQVRRKVAIVLIDNDELQTALDELIGKKYQNVFYVKRGEKFNRDGDIFYINPDIEYDYDKHCVEEIFHTLEGKYNGCDLYHLWGYNRKVEVSGIDDILSEQTYGLKSFFFFMKSIAKRGINGNIDAVMATCDTKAAVPGDSATGFLYGALSGIIKTLMIEVPRLRMKSIDLEHNGLSHVHAANIFFEEIRASKISDIVAYRSGKRYVKVIAPALFEDEPLNKVLKDDGVYLIVGGAGSVGLKVAGYITENVNAKIILTGRSANCEVIEKKIAKFSGSGSEVIYLQADIVNETQVRNLVKNIKRKYGAVHGMVHSVGVLDDKFFVKKDWSSSWNVIAPKMIGAWNLHNLTRNESLDFFVFFSSIVGVIGNMGQADYAAANSFLDNFAHFRQVNGFHGKSISINWTLWVDGGMGKQKAIVEAFSKRAGVIDAVSGIEGFDRIINGNYSQVMVAGKALVVNNPAQTAARADVQGEHVQKVKKTKPIQRKDKRLEHILISILAKIIEIDEVDLDVTSGFQEYGFDSVSFQELSAKINEELKTSINPTLFYEYPNVRNITAYLLETYELSEYLEETISGDYYEETKEILSRAAPVEPVDIKEKIGKELAAILARIIEVQPGELEINLDMRDYGVDSVGFTEFSEQINNAFNTSVNPTLFFEHTTIEALAENLAETYSFDNIFEEEVAAPVIPAKPGSSKEVVRQKLLMILAEVTGSDVSDLDIESDVRGYGMDSVGFTEFSEKINNELNTATNPTLFYEYPTISAITGYLIENYGLDYQEDVSTAGKAEVNKIPFNLKPDEGLSVVNKSFFSIMGRKKKAAASTAASYTSQPRRKDFEVAVVGISGRFPGAADYHEFWDILINGEDKVTLVPGERWDWKEYYGDPHGEANKTDSKWGGFIDDIKRFDARFFKISPHEAILMDPQQRLLIEEVWRAIEDSGQKPSSIAGTKTGIFIGAGNDDYNCLLIENDVRMDSYTSTGSYFTMLPNRISYLLDIHGPSMVVDNACASSLVALHQAVSSMRHGDCDNALVGAVNICCSPRRYISLSNANMLSKTGKCKAFDKDADGFVKGEGVVALFLKPLDKAIADGNPIYGVVKSTAVNHSGFSTSLTAPNPNAQADVILEAHKKSGLDPSTITYIEAQGTGTKLGDPIEINALKKSFKELYNDWGGPSVKEKSCGIGSFKPNIGHLEAAAGLTAMVKVLLSMKHREIPATIGIGEVNPYITFEGSPFYLVQERKKWERLKKGPEEIPRRAGISAFGFGGANAHVVLEEYPSKHRAIDAFMSTDPAIIVFSARDNERLKAYTRKMVEFIEKNPGISIYDFAYSLQMARDPMAARIAVVAADMDDVKAALTEFYQDKIKVKNLFRSEGGQGAADFVKLISGRAGEQFLKTIIEDKEVEKLARLWVSGLEMDWMILYGGKKPQLMALPGYPFGGEKHWISRTDVVAVSSSPGKKRLHQMIESNISTLREQKFTTRLSGTEFYLEDHVVAGQRVLPGVAYIEMARAAGELAGETRVNMIKNIFWMHPVVLDGQSKEVSIVFTPERDYVGYQINSGDFDHGIVLNCQGKVYYETGLPGRGIINPEDVHSRCGTFRSKKECYALFAEVSLLYGESFQGIDRMYYNSMEGISTIILPEKVKHSFREFILHPSIMDSAVQTIYGVVGEKIVSAGSGYLPFSINAVEIYGDLPDVCYAYVKARKHVEQGDKDIYFDIAILDNSGRVAVFMDNLAIRSFQQPSAKDGGVQAQRKKPLTDEQVLELLRKLKDGELETEQADQLIGGYYG